MSEYRIRKGTLDDIEALIHQYQCLYEVLSSFGLPYDFDEDGFRSHSEALFRSKMFYLGVADSVDPQQKGICGFIVVAIRQAGGWLKYHEKSKIGYVNDVFVLPEHRRGGCAKMLLEAAEQWLKDADIEFVECVVMSENRQGLGFWEKQGYEEYGKHLYRILT